MGSPLSEAEMLREFTKFWLDGALSCGNVTLRAVEEMTAGVEGNETGLGRVVYGSDYPGKYTTAWCF